MNEFENGNFNNENNIPEEQKVYYATPISVPDKKGNGKNVLTVVLCVVLSFVIGISSGALTAKYIVEKSGGNQTNGETLNKTNVTITVDETANSTIEAVAKKVNPSVVGIRTTAAVQSFFGGNTESTGEGSGVVYSEDGYVITNYHVIESATGRTNASIEVYFANASEEAVSATVVGYNITYDLAVIKVNKKGLSPIELADASKLAVGQYVAAIGAPGGLEYMGSVSYGIISGLNRTISTTNAADKEVSLIQTDAAINPGNSGGALVDIQGRLVGISSSKIVSESFEGMGFAIPVDTVKDICDKIIAKEYNPDPYIGVTISQSWTAERLEKYGYPAGAVVNSVVESGPASAAGIKSGDIITEFNKKNITSAEGLTNALSSCKPGDTVSVKIYRSGRYYTTAVTVSSNNAQ
ncbi:MAG: PDZ domain-containing protein [Ruminococcaceae bacterium]|nr:PDZ domain-containing protein [Oscillospiraceae bacterium]